MGTKQATVLQNYAKHVVLSVLGLRGTYQEDENDEEPTSAPATCKRPLDLRESVVHSLYKKPKINHPDNIAPLPAPPSDNDHNTYHLDENWLDIKFDDEIEDNNSEDSEEDEIYSDNEGEDVEEHWTEDWTSYLPSYNLFSSIH